MAVVSSVIVPYASYLRVYEPLAAFPEPERGHWHALRRARAHSHGPGRTPARAGRLGAHPARPGAGARERGRVRGRGRRGGVRLPVADPAARLAGPGGARGPVPRAGPGRACCPPVVRRQAAADYERWRERNPDARPWILTSVWHVPVSWFTVFSDEEREYAPGEGATAPVLRYRTPMVQARRRLARALRTLRDHIDEGPLTEGLVDVGRWLEEFHPRSLVELDYGGLVHALPHGSLEADRSAADVAEGIAALRAGDDARRGGGVRPLHGALAGRQGPPDGQLRRPAGPGAFEGPTGVFMRPSVGSSGAFGRPRGLQDVGPDPGLCLKRDGPHLSRPCAQTPPSCQNRTRSPGRIPSAQLWADCSALLCYGGSDDS